MRDAALRYGYGAVSDFYVAAYAYLSGQDYVVAYFGRSGQAYLGAEQGVVAYGAAVAYVDQVVQFCASSYAGLAYAGSVDAGVGLEFGVALDYYVAGLGDLVPAAGVFFVVFVMLGEAEAVASLLLLRFGEGRCLRDGRILLLRRGRGQRNCCL